MDYAGCRGIGENLFLDAENILKEKSESLKRKNSPKNYDTREDLHFHELLQIKTVENPTTQTETQKVK